MSEALVRASIPKSSWAEVQRSPPSARDHILRVLGGSFAHEIDATLAVAWVPFAVEAHMADAVYEALGPTGARAFYREKTLHSFDVAWLKPLISASRRLFGATPNSFLKMLPRAWSTLSKDCGEYAWEAMGERSGASVIRAFPTQLYRRKEAWLESIIGGYEAFFGPFSLRGTVEAEDIDLARGHGRFVLSW